MVSAGFLAAAERAEPISPECLAGPGDVLVLAPHPDDETLGCGATIAALAELGRRVQVVIVTDGAASHPASRRCPPPALARLRAREAREAVRILGCGRLPPPLHLGIPDSAPPEDARTQDRVLALLARSLTPRTTAILTTWDGDPHPDHQWTARLARRLSWRAPEAALWAYPIWGRFTDRVPEPAQPVVRVAAHQAGARKRRALRAHRSQMTGLIADDPDGFVMAPALQEHFLDADEVFIQWT
jgi:LmbE family N-acetylglucosaminyl deacetylase